MVQLLLSRDEKAWDELVHEVGRGSSSLQPETALALLEEAAFEEWSRLAEQRLMQSDQITIVGRPLRAFRLWLIDSALQALPDDDPRRFDLRFRRLQYEPGEDGGFEAGRALLDDLTSSHASPAIIAEVARLTVRGAFTVRDYGAALELARIAHRAYASADQPQRGAVARRQEAAALLYLGELEAGFRLYGELLHEPGPLFGGGGTFVYSPATNAWEAALDEVAAVGAWAEHSTPEWVRAVGGLAERCDHDEQREHLWKLFEDHMDRLLDESERPESDIEVIVRQSGERDLFETSLRALHRYRDVFPSDGWAADQLHVVQRHCDARRLIERLDDEDAHEAIDALSRMLRDMSHDGSLGETNLTFDITDKLVARLLEDRDERAVDVQRLLLDDKLEKYGECPAAWLERQNLGTVLAALGRRDDAVAELETALAAQRDYFGDEHPHVQMTRRNLGRIRDVE